MSKVLTQAKNFLTLDALKMFFLQQRLVVIYTVSVSSLGPHVSVFVFTVSSSAENAILKLQGHWIQTSLLWAAGGGLWSCVKQMIQRGPAVSHWLFRFSDNQNQKLHEGQGTTSGWDACRKLWWRNAFHVGSFWVCSKCKMSQYRWVPLNSKLIYQVKVLRIKWAD